MIFTDTKGRFILPGVSEIGTNMAVVKSKQGESELEFLNTARNLEVFTLKQLVSLIPKRYTFYIGVPISDLAHSIYAYLKRANSIFPTTVAESEQRLSYLHRAQGDLHALISEIEIAHTLLSFDVTVFEKWMSFITEEDRLIKGCIKHEREKRKKLMAQK